MSGEDRHRQLIDVAIELFSEKGFTGTTTKEIAAAAGVTEAIVFRHFASKQDFYTAILEQISCARLTEHWWAEAQAYMDRNDDEGLFRLLVTRILEGSRDDPRFERLIMRATLENHELAAMHFQQFALPVGDRLMEYIRRRQAEGAIAQCNPCMVLISVVGLAKFYALQKYVYKFNRVNEPDEEAIDCFMAILMNGLRREK